MKKYDVYILFDLFSDILVLKPNHFPTFLREIRTGTNGFHLKMSENYFGGRQGGFGGFPPDDLKFGGR